MTKVEIDVVRAICRMRASVSWLNRFSRKIASTPSTGKKVTIVRIQFMVSPGGQASVFWRSWSYDRTK